MERERHLGRVAHAPDDPNESRFGHPLVALSGAKEFRAGSSHLRTDTVASSNPLPLVDILLQDTAQLGRHRHEPLLPAAPAFAALNPDRLVPQVHVGIAQAKDIAPA